MEATLNFRSLPPSYVDYYRQGDYGKLYGLQDKANNDLQLVYQQIMDFGDQAFATIEVGGQQLRVSYVVGVGTVFVWAKPPSKDSLGSRGRFNTP